MGIPSTRNTMIYCRVMVGLRGRRNVGGYLLQVWMYMLTFPRVYCGYPWRRGWLACRFCSIKWDDDYTDVYSYWSRHVGMYACLLEQIFVEAILIDDTPIGTDVWHGFLFGPAVLISKTGSQMWLSAKITVKHGKKRKETDPAHGM